MVYTTDQVMAMAQRILKLNDLIAVLMVISCTSVCVWGQTIACGYRVGITAAGDYVNVRSAPCGSILGQIRAGNEGQVASSSCSGTGSCSSYTFWNVLPHGWIAAGPSSAPWLVAMPGEGYYPNVRNTNGAYPVRVYNDSGNLLRWRLGPGTNYPELGSPKSVGTTGTAYAVRVRTDEQLVWWRIRWSDGTIGWSADSQVPYGVYLVRTGSPSSFSVVSLRIESMGASSVGIEVRVPDLDAVVPPNYTVYTTTTLRYVYGDTVRLIAPASAGGYSFREWRRNGSSYSTNRDITFSIYSNDTFTAVYAPPSYTISIQSSNPSSGVSIVVSPPDNNGQSNGTTPFSRTYNQGASVTLTAPDTAPNGNRFQEWRRNNSFYSSSRTTSFTVNANDTFTAVYASPQIQIQLSGESIDFCDIWNLTTAERSLTITNSSSSTANLNITVGSLSAPFSVVSGQGSYTLSPGQSHTVRVRFAPQNLGSYSANLTITHNATNRASPINIPVSGHSCSGEIEIRNSSGQRITSLSFKANVGSSREQTVYAINTAASGSRCTLNVSASIVNNDGSFSVSPTSFTLTSSGQQLVIRFQPTSSGTRQAQLRLRYSLCGDPSAQREVSITLTGSALGGGSSQSTEAEFLRNLVAPWRQGQYWRPSTYSGHPPGGTLFAVDFNKVVDRTQSCPYASGVLNDCDEVVVASHAGTAYHRTQSGCSGYGNYVVVVSNVRVPATSSTYLATLYAHLNYFLKDNGAPVSVGQPIARVGATGTATCSHLHYEILEVTVSGSTLTLGTRRQVLNNDTIRLSGQPLQVDLNCRVYLNERDYIYVGPPILGTASVDSIPGNIVGTCSPTCGNQCGNFLWSSEEVPGRCIPHELPSVIYLTDVNGDGCVDDADLLEVLQVRGADVSELPSRAADVNWDGVVDETDLLMVLMDMGNCSY